MKFSYAQVPKNPDKNRQFRADLLKTAEGSPAVRDYLKQACTEDILFYLNTFVWLYEPRLETKIIPFTTFDFQDDAIRNIEYAIDKHRDLVIEKSRDMGASWMCLSVFEHRWHFCKEPVSFLCVSRDADEVDKSGNTDCLFAKIDMIHKRTPKWLLPKNWPSHGKKSYRNRMSFENPETESTINGEATVAGVGVGGRRTAILLDEFSRVREGREMDLGTADTTRCRIFNFTAYGTDNAAYELVRNKYKRKLRLHWSMDPRKNRKMYQWDEQKQRYKYLEWKDGQLSECGPHSYGVEDADTVNFDPPGRPFEPVPDGVLRSPVYDAEDTRRGNRRYMAIMWDIDYEGSDSRVYPEKLLIELNRETCCTPFWEGDFEVDPSSGELLGLSPRKDGPLRFWTHLSGGQPPASKLGYGAGCDISYGRGASNSALSIANADTGEKVCEYVRPDEAPERFATKVVALCKLFKSQSGMTAKLAWERIGPGAVFGDAVMADLHYGNIYYHGAEATKDFRNRRKPGWPPLNANKAEAHGLYLTALSQRRFINRSAEALKECQCFYWAPGTVEYRTPAGRGTVAGDDDPSGARENHGDRVTADFLALFAVKDLGGGAPPEKQKPAADPDLIPGTRAWRAKLHQEREQREDSYWS